MAGSRVTVNRDGLDKLRKRLKSMGDAVEVGVFGGKYPNGLSVAANAAIHNFGTDKIPARPFMTNAANELGNRETEVGKILENSIKKSVNPNARLGAFAAQLVRAEIRDGDLVRLKPATIKRKGSSRPLIDTGKLIQAITFRDAT